MFIIALQLLASKQKGSNFTTDGTIISILYLPKVQLPCLGMGSAHTEIPHSKGQIIKWTTITTYTSKASNRNKCTIGV